MESGPVDPASVLPALVTGVQGLQVSSLPTSSEPTTPSSESPLSLDAGLREWLTEALVANSTNPKVYCKLLVSNAAAGSVIGKAGSNINDVQAKTYARIQLSKANEYFPGTTERTLLVTGRLKQVVAALGLVFAKLLREGVAPLSPRSKAAASYRQSNGSAGQGSDLGSGSEEAGADSGSEAGLGGGSDAGSGGAAPQRLLVRLLVPQPLCGVIIGKNGATIRQYAADTRTVIRVTSGEAAQVPTSHRIVTIAGEVDGVLKAIALMVLKQSDDPKFPLYGELPSPAVAGHLGPPGAPPMGVLPPGGPFHPGLPFLPPLGMPGAPGAPGMWGGALPPFGGPPAMAGAGAGEGCGITSLNLMLTEDQAAVLLDQGSRAVLEVEQMSGCRSRLEMAEGPRGPFGRLVLSGPPEAVAFGQWLLGQRLSAAASYQLGGTTYYSYPSGPAPVGPYVPAPPPAMAPFLAAPWQAAPGGLVPPGAAQQQQMMAAAAAAAQGMVSVGPLPLARAGSDSA